MFDMHHFCAYFNIRRETPPVILIIEQKHIDCLLVTTVWTPLSLEKTQCGLIFAISYYKSEKKSFYFYIITIRTNIPQYMLMITQERTT